MTTPTTEEVLAQVHPDLHPVVREFMRRSKHALRLEAGFAYFRVDDSDNDNVAHSGVRFYDNSTTGTEVGAVRLDKDTQNKRMYRVITRHNINPRFKSRERRHSVNTTDSKRAVKAMLQYITPFTLDEIVHPYQGIGSDLVSGWRNELREDVRKLSVPQSAILTEMQNLVRQGVKFITPEFNLIAEKALAAHEETQRRMGAKVTKHFVSVGGNQISVLTVYNDNTRASNFYPAFEAMPMLLQEGVAMLRIMQDHQHIDGFGARISEHMFVVLEIDQQKA